MSKLFILSNGLWISPENVSVDTQDAHVVAQASSLGANSINPLTALWALTFWDHNCKSSKYYENNSSSIVFTVKSINVDQMQQQKLSQLTFYKAIK